MSIPKSFSIKILLFLYSWPIKVIIRKQDHRYSYTFNGISRVFYLIDCLFFGGSGMQSVIIRNSRLIEIIGLVRSLIN